MGKPTICICISRLMGKPTICICENKDADQLRGNRLQFLSYLNPKYQASSSFLCLYRPVCVRLTCSETTLLVFPRGGSYGTKMQFDIMLQNRIKKKREVRTKFQKHLANSMSPRPSIAENSTAMVESMLLFFRAGPVICIMFCSIHRNRNTRYYSFQWFQESFNINVNSKGKRCLCMRKPTNCVSDQV